MSSSTPTSFDIAFAFVVIAAFVTTVLGFVQARYYKKQEPTWIRLIMYACILVLIVAGFATIYTWETRNVTAASSRD